MLLLFTITFCCFISCGDKNTPPPNPTTDVQSPSGTNRLTGTATTTSVSLSWNASTDNVGVTGYKIYRNAAGLAGTTAINSFVDNGLIAGIQYSYTVAAYDAAGNNSAPLLHLLPNNTPPEQHLVASRPSLMHLRFLEG
ncbi:MAG: hypothetical protein IPM85_17245 [Chitinophagaceae bacterium]|nr:hypothetical protein [Chitinophagaceae bacterium]